MFDCRWGANQLIAESFPPAAKTCAMEQRNIASDETVDWESTPRRESAASKHMYGV
jgi:hypothetical protein